MATLDHGNIENQIFVVGCNSQGELALGHSNHVTALTEWTQNIQVSTINCDGGFMIVRDQNNSIWCVGWNSFGQLGLGHRSRVKERLVQNKYFSNNNINIKSILTNTTCHSTFFVSQTNKLYACGINNANQLGINPNQNITVPSLINNVPNIKDAQNGGSTILLDNNGTVYSTKRQFRGDNYGHNGDGIHNFSNHSNGFHPIPFFENKTITEISVGNDHSLFVDSQSNIWSCGKNNFGQLGLGHFNSTKNQNPQLISYFANNMITITKMCSGPNNNLCIDDNGIIYAFGWNYYGNCGLPKDIEKTHTPIKMYSLSNHKIIDIKCGYTHSYCKSDKHKHWLFGDNNNNICSLSNGKNIYGPFCINETVNKLTNGKHIKDVFVGSGCTWIITNVNNSDSAESYAVIDEEKMKDILNKNNESLEETKDLIAELTNTFLDTDSKDKNDENIIPEEMTDFFKSVQDDLGCVAEAQSQLQNTMELFDQILQHKPDDYDSNPASKKLWDSILENTKNTMNDIEMVQNMRDDYIGDLVEITELMNDVETEEDTVQLTKQIKAMTAAQEQYKAKIMEATQNALKSLKSFMKENVTKKEVDKISNDITTYQKLHFETDKEINELYMKKTTEINVINTNIKIEKIELNKIESRKDDIKEELNEINKLKIGREDSIKVSELLYARNNLRSVECTCTRYRRCSVIHVNHVNNWTIWKIVHSSETLEMEEDKLNKECKQLELDKHKVELKINHYTEKKAKVKKQFNQQIAIKKVESNEYKNKFNKAMGDLDKTIKKTSVKENKLKEFIN
eukprot:67223_1